MWIKRIRFVKKKYQICFYVDKKKKKKKKICKEKIRYVFEHIIKKAFEKKDLHS